MPSPHVDASWRAGSCRPSPRPHPVQALPPSLTRRRIVWVSTGTPTTGLAMSYPQVVMHAISTDPAAFAKPCLYLQIDEGEAGAAVGGADDEGDEDDVAEQATAEVRLVPADPAQGRAGGPRWRVPRIASGRL